MRKEHNSKLTVTYPSTVYRKSGEEGILDQTAGEIFVFYSNILHFFPAFKGHRFLAVTVHLELILIITKPLSLVVRDHNSIKFQF